MSDDNFDLDTDLDDVADLAQFTNPHDGTHVFGIIYAGPDKIGQKRGIKIIYQLVATLESANPEEDKAPVGSLFSESFTGNDMGKKLLKLRIKQMFGAEVGGSIRQYLDALNGQFRTDAMVKMTTKVVHSNGKDAAGKKVVYENVRILDAQPVEPIPLPDKFEWQEYTPTIEED